MKPSTDSKTSGKETREAENASLLVTFLDNAEFRKTLIIFGVLKLIVNEVSSNAEFYSDFLKFNFDNGVEFKKTYDKLHFSDIPSNENKRLIKLEKLFGKRSKAEIFEMLGMRQTRKNMYSPLQEKWVYEYFKKFKTYEYSEKNIVNDEEILRSLSILEQINNIKAELA